ncbi:MAG: hypothetical protein JW866_11200 [Ignavibacteriales bacterium]|nr:hypothetical protein [Ignavibacteriales bacterium]
MKFFIVLMSFISYSIFLCAQNIKPIINQMDSTKYFSDLNNNEHDIGENLSAKIEIEDFGFNRSNSFSKKTYFFNFKLINNGDVYISDANITIEWFTANNEKLLHSQNEYVVNITDKKLKPGQSKNKFIEFPTFIEGHSNDIISVNAYLSVQGIKTKLFERFIILKKEFNIPVNKLIELEILKKGYGEDFGSKGDKILVGRIDYQIKNISDKDIDFPVILKLIWKNATKNEIFNETEEYVVDNTDKLKVGEVKTLYSTSGKGFTNAKVFPFNMTIDIIMIDNGEEMLIQKDLKINYRED